MTDDDDDEIGGQVVGAVRREIEPANLAVVGDLEEGAKQLALAAARTAAAEAAFQRGPDVTLFGDSGLPAPDLGWVLMVSMICLSSICRTWLCPACGPSWPGSGPDGLWPGARWNARLLTPRARRAARAGLGQQFEPQRARDWCSFYQTDVDDVTQPVHGTAARADQRVAALVVIEIFASPPCGSGRDRRRRCRPA